MQQQAEFIQLNEAITLINDRNESTYYLVCGTEKALMIDTGNGYDNVMEIAQGITNLPIEVVNTHGHCDHVYGNVFCEEVWMHPSDFSICENHFEMLQSDKSKQNLKCCPLRPLYKGKIFDLGELELEVIEIQGHTPGSIGLLERKHRILFSGDALNSMVWLQLEESLPLSQVRKNISDMMLKYGDSFDYHLSGHTKVLIPKHAILDLIKGFDEILTAKNIEDEDYIWFGGIHKHHFYGENEWQQICYDPKKL